MVVPRMKRGQVFIDQGVKRTGWMTVPFLPDRGDDRRRQFFDRRRQPPLALTKWTPVGARRLNATEFRFRWLVPRIKPPSSDDALTDTTHAGFRFGSPWRTLTLLLPP